MSTLHRRDWLKQSSLALTGLGLSLPQLAIATRTKQSFDTARIRLTSNENPYGPSPMARKAMSEAVNLSNRYPWDMTTRFLDKLGKLYGLSSEHVLLGAGSSEILGLVTQLAALEKGNAVTASPAFSSWIAAAQKQGLEVIKVPLNEKKEHVFSEMLSKQNKSIRLFYICNPNNPTGTLFSSQMIKNVAEEASKNSLVLVDEAYMEYSNETSVADIVDKNKNVVIAKTFSKIYGMAGARIGYALGHPDTIRQIGALQPWSNAGASAVSLAGANASIDDKVFVSDSKKWNEEARNYTEQELRNLGFQVIPSVTNFIYYSLGNNKNNWHSALEAKNIFTGRIVETQGQWTRVTIGTMNEMKQFISAAKSIV